MSPPLAKVILQTSQVPTTALPRSEESVLSASPVVAPRTLQNLPPKLGDVPEGLNMLEGVRMEVARMALTDQLTADGPSTTLTAEQAQLAAGWFPQSPQPIR